MNRPLVPVVLAFAAGIGSAAYLGSDYLLWWLILTASALIVAAYSPGAGLGRVVTVCLAFFAAGGVWWTARHTEFPDDALYHTLLNQPERDAWTFEGRVRSTGSITPHDHYQRFILDVSQIERGDGREPIEGRMQVRWSNSGRTLYPGDHIRLKGHARSTIGPVNPRLQSEEDYLRRRDVHSSIRIRGDDAVERVSETPPWNLRYAVARLRHAQQTRLAAAVPESVLPFVLAVWLGDRSGVAREEIDAYARSGTAHILAVSGIHVGLLYASVSMMVGLITVNRRRRAGVVLAVLIVYALLAGARTPTIRAVTMVSFYLAAGWLDREPDVPSALAAAGFLLLLITPSALFDLGFQLSFLSVSSILIFHEAFARGLFFFPQAIREGGSATLAVQILPLPLAAQHFGILPLLASLTNLIVVPLLSVALWFAFLTSLCSWISISVAGLFGHAMAPVVYLIRMVSGYAAETDHAVLRLTAPTIFAMAAFWGAAMLLGCAVKRIHPRRCLAGAAVLLVVAIVAWTPLRYTPEVVFLDVGHGDATFIRTRYGATVLVDAGDRMPFVDQGARVVEPFLRASGVRRLDYLIITHPHRDHIGGAFHIVENMPVGEVILGGIPFDTALEKDFLALCAERDIPLRRVVRGDMLALTGGFIEFLHPPNPWPEHLGLNNASVVACVHLEGLVGLLPGDAEREAERVLAQLDCRAPLLKTPHHGSNTSSTDAFLDSVQPMVSVASTSYGGVDAAVRARYQDRGIPLLRTDYHGGITVRPEEGAFRLEGARMARGYRPAEVMAPSMER